MNAVLCLLCAREQVEVHKLSSHIASDLNYAPFSCGECAFSSADKNSVVFHTFQEKHFSRKINSCPRPYVESLIDRIVADCLHASNNGLQAVLSKDALEAPSSMSPSTSFIAQPDQTGQVALPPILAAEPLRSPSPLICVKLEPLVDQTALSPAFNSQPQDEMPQLDAVSETDGRKSTNLLNEESSPSAADETIDDERPEALPAIECCDETPSGTTKKLRRTKRISHKPTHFTSPVMVSRRSPSVVDSTKHSNHTSETRKSSNQQRLVVSNESCFLCGGLFTSLNRQWIHAAVHLKEVLSCPFCDYRDISVKRLMKHARSVHHYEHFILFDVREYARLSEMYVKCFATTTTTQTSSKSKNSKASPKRAETVSEIVHMVSKNIKSPTSSVKLQSSKAKFPSTDTTLPSIDLKTLTKNVRRRSSVLEAKKSPIHRDRKQVDCKSCGAKILNNFYYKRAHTINVHVPQTSKTASFFKSTEFHTIYADCFGSTAARGYGALGINCTMCGEATTTLAARQTHVLTKHINRELECPICESFRTDLADKFIEHIRIFHRNVPTSTPFECLIEMKEMVINCFQQTDA